MELKSQAFKKINLQNVGKKSILYTGVALVAFSTVVLASVSGSKIQEQQMVSCSLSRATPLQIAIQKGEIDLVRKMIEYGADVNEQTSGMTPLMVAARYNKVEIIKYLLAHGAKTDIKDDKGFTALKHAELSLAADAALVLKRA